MPAKHLLTFYTRTPLHIGCGTSVDVVDLPIRRERITNYPILPNSGLKGVLLQAAREKWGDARRQEPPPEGMILFGTADDTDPKATDDQGKPKKLAYSGCAQIMEGKLLAFPIRSVAGGFAWLTCPTALLRFQRDTGRTFDHPKPAVDEVALPADSDLKLSDEVVFEEFALKIDETQTAKADATLKDIQDLCDDPVWTCHIANRLAIVSDENFQHFVTACTEVVTRIAIDPATRTVDGGALFNQENVPCETLFYNVVTILRPLHGGGVKSSGKATTEEDADQLFQIIVPENDLLLQLGGDATTGHGFCAVKRLSPPDKKEVHP